jgi:dipeptidyl aminopeptidase/acylaminoacyl peptidase
MATDGSGSPELLLKREIPVRLPASWSPDGQSIAFVEMNRNTGTDIWLLELKDTPSVMPYLVTPFEEHSAQISPDGRWLAYISNESGQEEVYVQPFPRPGRKWTISSAGGVEPRWSPDGKELYYRSAAEMMAVSVDTVQGFVAGSPRVLFEDTFQTSSLGVANYDVAPEGDRFLLVQNSEKSSEPAQLKVVLNWTEELQRQKGER